MCSDKELRFRARQTGSSPSLATSLLIIWGKLFNLISKMVMVTILI